MLLKTIRSLCSLFAVSVVLSACGGGSDSGSSSSSSSVAPASYSIGGSVTGLGSSKSLVLQNNTGNDLTVSSTGSFIFTSKITSGGSYSVAVKTQPDGQTCLVTNASGTSVTSDILSVSVSCTDITYTLSGTVSGLAPDASVILSNSSNNVTVLTNGTFSFGSTLSYKGSYAVTISTQPSGQSCLLSNASGTGITNDIVNISVSCSDAPLPVTAADGAALSFGTVTVKSLVDGTSYTARLNASGQLNIPPSTVTYPALIKAVPPSNDKVLYSYIRGVAQGSASITPMSTLKVAFAAKGDPAYITAPLSGQSLYEAKTKTSAIFSSIFTAFEVTKTPRVDTSELFTIYFPTDHTGFDLMLDSIDIKFDTLGNPTICTRLTNFCKTLDVTNPDTTPIVIPDAEVSGLKNLPFTLCSQTFDKLDINQLGINASLYSTGFFDSGLDAAGYRNALQDLIKTKYSGISAAIYRPRFINVDSNGNYLFLVGVFNTTNNTYLFGKSFYLKAEGGKCVMVGDQFPFSVSASTLVASWNRVDGTSTTSAARALGGITANAASVDSFGNILVRSIDSNNLPIFTDATGATLPVKSLSLSWCNTNNECLQMMTLNLKRWGSFEDDTSSRVAGVFKSFSYLGISSPDIFYNGNPYPVEVKMLGDNSIELKKIRLPIIGNYISSNEEKVITLPSITNPTTLLTSVTTDSTIFNVNVPSGDLLQGATLQLLSINSIGQPYFSNNASATSVGINATYPVTQVTISKGMSDQFAYRAITLNGTGKITNPFRYKLTYFWSPTCTQCGTP